MSGNEFITAGGLSEYLSQEYDENETSETEESIFDTEEKEDLDTKIIGA
jgi:hypothetical protein